MVEGLGSRVLGLGCGSTTKAIPGLSAICSNAGPKLRSEVVGAVLRGPEYTSTPNISPTSP